MAFEHKKPKPLIKLASAISTGINCVAAILILAVLLDMAFFHVLFEFPGWKRMGLRTGVGVSILVLQLWSERYKSRWLLDGAAAEIHHRDVLIVGVSALIFFACSFGWWGLAIGIPFSAGISYWQEQIIRRNENQRKELDFWTNYRDEKKRATHAP